MKKGKLSPYLRRKITVSNIFFLLFIICSIIALLNPKWGITYAPAENVRGLDIVYAIDISRSMDTRDVHAGGMRLSRLERAVVLAKYATLTVPGGRFAAAIGRGRGYLSVPLTYDNEAVITFLETLDTYAVTGRSTNLQALIEAGASAFQSTSPARKVIVLLSDGESHLGVIRNAINLCIREDIIIISCGIGSDEGAEVPGIPEGPVPVSRRDSAQLRLAAERTGGIYIDGNREDASGILRAQLNSLSNNVSFMESERKTEPKQQRSLFVILAIISFGLSKFVLRVFKKRSSGGQINRSIAAAVIMCVFIFSSCTEGKLLLIEANYLFSRGRYEEAAVSYFKALEYEESAPYAEYGLGITYHFMDENSGALNRYANSLELLKNLSDDEHRELRYRIFYNTGIIYFEEGNYDAAAAFFRDALKIDPAKVDAKRNLEISMMSIIRNSSKDQQTETYNETKDVIFEFVKQQEQPYWMSGEWQAEEEFLGQDY